jgi:hypothetical protein
MVNLRHPLNTKFLIAYSAAGPNPNTRISAFDCLLTASIPIAPMYLLHLSFTFSSFMSIYWPVRSFLSYSTSISSWVSSYSFLSMSPVYFFFFCFLAAFLDVMSWMEGTDNFLNSWSNSYIAFYSISLYWFFDFLNSVDHELL